MTYFKLKLTLFLITAFSTSSLYAQFQLVGTARTLVDDCFELTPTQDGSEGAVWFTPKINLEESFDITTEFNFGCSDNGADGMAFVLQPSSDALGGGGGGLGYNYLWNSFAIEFDTHKNSLQNDPYYDHIAFMARGKIDHSDVEYNLAGPVQAAPNNENIEDCDYHEIRITWDAVIKEFQVFFDCDLRLSYTGNIVKYFDNDPYVYAGFTAATGAKNNRQIVCMKTFKTIEPLPNYVMCPDGNIQLEAKGGTQYQWAPTETLNNSNIANPLASPEQTTTYFVTITDGCVDFFDSLTIHINGDFVDFNFSDTSLCEDESILLDATTNNAVYEWSNGAITSSISPTQSGYYVVTVTLDNLCVSNDAAQVNFISLPPILFTEYESICPGQTILLDATFPDATFLWQDGSTEPLFEVTEAGEYSVLIDHFCETKTLSTDIAFESSCTDVFIPNAFSPNFDGTNDYFMIMDGGDIEIVNHFRIADRWGNIIFEAKNFPANDQTYGWNGTFKGKDVVNGVYVYMVEVVFRNGESRLLKGDIAVVR